MTSGNIFLILISGLGVLHGFFLAIFLWVYNEGDRTSNKLLSLLLLVLSFRVGKSVFLEFTQDLDIQFIFTGLALIMAIGPLFHLYTLSIIKKGFGMKKKYLLQFLPVLLGLLFGLWINNDRISTIPKWVLITLFLTYYSHYLIYIFISYRSIQKKQNTAIDANARSLLRLLRYALLSIWFTYMLNLFDDIIPYIFGPILYTLVAYTISFIVIKKGYIQKTAQSPKYKTTSVSDEQVEQIFKKVQQLVIHEEQFKNGDLSLKLLSNQLGVTPQTLSMVINQRTKTNFNNFINQLRVEESVRMFQDGLYENRTIASIAFDAGFNSISSFNTAFKKMKGSTPTAFRKNIGK